MTTQIIIIAVCIIGIIVCFIVANSFNNKEDQPEQIIEIHDAIAIEVNGDLPDKTSFFKELQGVEEKAISVDYTEVDPSKIGDYPVILSINNKNYNVTLNVVDTQSPNLTTKNLTIAAGQSYYADDFVKSCTDNSNEDCSVAFYDSSLTQDGESIDYSHYTEEGVYAIQIIAMDESGNISTPINATLTIGESSTTQDPNENEDPIVCKYGDNNYDTSKYILATYVTEKNCAIDLNLYHEETTREAVNKIMEDQTTKLKTEFQKQSIKAPVTVNRKAEAVLNLEGTGLVGYTLYIEASITKNNEQTIVAAFYVNLDGSRTYTINTYNLP